MRNTITRSICKNSCTTVIFKDGKLDEEVIVIPCGYNDNDAAERYIRRNNLSTGKLVEVSKVERINNLYGMEEDMFIKLAIAVDERSKETRNCISKTVTTKCARLVYMTSDRKIADINIILPNNIGKREMASFIKNSTPAGGKPIEVTDIEEVEKLYVLDEATFIENSREMIDHFHYKV